MYLKELVIGDVKLENNIILAPMAGITDRPFRIICKKYSNPGLVCTEMISSKAIYYEDEKTKKMLNINGEKRPICVQIFGSDPEIMKFSAKVIENKANIIDINMGCPAPKIVKNGDGSKLLLNLNLIGEIVESVVNAVSIPVTVKIRKGWDNDNIVALEAAKIIEQAGAKAITIHGRTKEEYYSSSVDLDIIKKVKQNVNIPIIGNGDIRNCKEAYNMFEYTGVDGIMIGRATIGNPWLIGEIYEFLKTGKEKDSIKVNERFIVLKEHLNLLVKEKGEYIAIREMRKHICFYIKNLRDSSKIREKINNLESVEEVIDCLEEYFKTL